MTSEPRFRATERMLPGWTDWRAVYGTPTPEKWYKNWLIWLLTGILIATLLLVPS